MLACLAFLMSLEAKRLIDMPPSQGFLIAGLIVVQSIPHWLIERPSSFIYMLALLAAAIVFANVKKFLLATFVCLLSVCLGYTSLLLSNHLAIYYW